MGLKEIYQDEVFRDKQKYTGIIKEILKEADIMRLPGPVRKYYKRCGFLDREIMWNANLKWGDVFYKRAPNKEWMKLDCIQYNSVKAPTRIVYMSTKLLGFLPFEGRDKYLDGRGNMFIKILKFITFINARSMEMDITALATTLGEMLFLSGYSLQNYIKWTEIDSNTAKATVNFDNTEASGTFFFNEKGEMVRFETFDRYFSVDGKVYKKLKWTALAENYITKNGISFPSMIKALWNTPEGNIEYFRGNLKEIECNVFK